MIPLLILGGLFLGAFIVLALLEWDKIVGWFRGHQELKESDTDNIAFSIQKRLEDGKFKTVQGIFNKNTNEVLANEKYESKDIDEQLAEVHRNDELVIYE